MYYLPFFFYIYIYFLYVIEIIFIHSFIVAITIYYVMNISLWYKFFIIIISVSAYHILGYNTICLVKFWFCYDAYYLYH